MQESADPRAVGLDVIHDTLDLCSIGETDGCPGGVDRELLRERFYDLPLISE